MVTQVENAEQDRTLQDQLKDRNNASLSLRTWSGVLAAIGLIGALLIFLMASNFSVTGGSITRRFLLIGVGLGVIIFMLFVRQLLLALAELIRGQGRIEDLLRKQSESK